MQPYKLLRWTMTGLPACDRDEAHPIFYDAPTTFQATFDPAKAKLLGVQSADRSLIKPELMDKPQDVFPLTTPCERGRLHYLKGKFAATSWLAALRGAAVIHYFWHIDWELRYEGLLSEKGIFSGDYHTNILSQGAGQGSNSPKIDGVAANDLHDQIRTEWTFLPSGFSYRPSGSPLEDLT
jgi:hypothetical protein